MAHNWGFFTAIHKTELCLNWLEPTTHTYSWQSKKINESNFCN